jgi:hypothetical protein
MRESEMMKNQTIDPATVIGWGVDADPENDPTYPMRDRSREDKAGLNWVRPAQQDETVEVLQSIERNSLSAVFGTSTPPRGVSGMIRRQAFKFSESDWAHWLMLMAADRVSVVEGVVQDLGNGRIPNVPAEMGIRSELAHNRAGLARKVAVTGTAIGLGFLAASLISRRGAAGRSASPTASRRPSGKAGYSRTPRRLSG